MSIGERIKAARKDAGMSQLQLAQAVGIRQPTLSDLENDMSKGSSKLASIARALNVRPYWLETGRGTRTVDQSDGDGEIATLGADAIVIAQAFERLTSDAQREAVIAQLRAFGVLE